MNDLTETDICMKYITPAIQKAGWDTKKQVRREVTFTDGRINVRGNSYTRGKRKRADHTYENFLAKLVNKEFCEPKVQPIQV